jgi:ATP-binding cassette subfamily G (WHITE) protein 5 (sterolin 1)
MSIHQPRSDIFTLFDQIGILTQGEMLYFGARDQMLAHFTDAGFPCPQFANPLDYFGELPYVDVACVCVSVVDIAGIDRRSEAQESLSTQRIGRLREHYLHSAVYFNITNDIAVTKSRNGEMSVHPTDPVHLTSIAQRVAVFFSLVKILLGSVFRSLNDPMFVSYENPY